MAYACWLCKKSLKNYHLAIYEVLVFDYQKLVCGIIYDLIAITVGVNVNPRLLCSTIM